MNLGGVRPRRGWFLLVAAGLLAAAVLTVLARADGSVQERITSGQAVTVDVPPDGWLLWTTATGFAVRCQLAGDGTAGFSQRWMRDENLTAEWAGEQWRGVLHLQADPAGTHAVTCTSPDGLLAIGRPPMFATAAERTLALLGAGVLTVGSAVTAIVLVVRRRLAARRATRV